MSQSLLMKQKHHEPARVTVETTRAQVAAGTVSATAGAASVASAMGWTQGAAALYLQSGEEPVKPV
jgi:hypothetical protein